MISDRSAIISLNVSQGDSIAAECSRRTCRVCSSYVSASRAYCTFCGTWFDIAAMGSGFENLAEAESKMGVSAWQESLYDHAANFRRIATIALTTLILIGGTFLGVRSISAIDRENNAVVSAAMLGIAERYGNHRVASLGDTGLETSISWITDNQASVTFSADVGPIDSQTVQCDAGGTWRPVPIVQPLWRHRHPQFFRPAGFSGTKSSSVQASNYELISPPSDLQRD